MHDRLVFETASVRAEQSLEVAIPGYLILSSKQPVSEFSRMSEECAADLGRAIRLACRVVEEVIKPERIYVARFGEECAEIHFHILPRTRWLLEEYRRVTGASAGPASGAQLFGWARDAFRGKTAPQIPGITVSEAVRQMRSFSEQFRGSARSRRLGLEAGPGGRPVHEE
ncbi:MAG: HIT domain-containing protein [bacterium]